MFEYLLYYLLFCWVVIGGPAVFWVSVVEKRPPSRDEVLIIAVASATPLVNISLVLWVFGELAGKIKPPKF